MFAFTNVFLIRAKFLLRHLSDLLSFFTFINLHQTNQQKVAAVIAFYSICIIEIKTSERTKINKKRPGLDHFLKKNQQNPLSWKFVLPFLDFPSFDCLSCSIDSKNCFCLWGSNPWRLLLWQLH